MGQVQSAAAAQRLPSVELEELCLPGSLWGMGAGEVRSIGVIYLYYLFSFQG